MNKMICMVATLVSLTCATNATAQSKRLQEKVKGFFLQSLTTQQKTLENDGREAFVRNHPTDTQLQTPIEGNNVANYQAMVWTAWCEANKGLQEEKLIAPDDLQQEKHSAWNLPTCLEPNATMPYYYGRKGASAENGATTKAPLFLYLHGSGPKQTEWANGIKLGQRFQDAPSIYFIPQIPNEGEYYRWWQLAKQYAWEKLIRQALASGEVDANRLYVFGISEGGYGSQRLASFYADYWAAAGPMAGGEPLKNAPVENCANIGFSFLTGADDRGSTATNSPGTRKWRSIPCSWPGRCRQTSSRSSGIAYSSFQKCNITFPTVSPLRGSNNLCAIPTPRRCYGRTMRWTDATAQASTTCRFWSARRRQEPFTR